VRSNDSLISEGWIQDNAFLVTIYTGASVTTTSPDIIIQPEKTSQPYVLQMLSGETIPTLKEVLGADIGV
jgi:hypothetical protein